MKITDLFVPSYGTKFDLNKMTIVDNSDRNGINFVSRSSKNLGVVGKVKKLTNKEPYPAGLITVTLGGTYLLSSFVQPEPFYTAQNIMILKPKREMILQEKIFYCICIAKNRFRYVSHGREANRTLKDLEIPSKIPDWVNSFHIPKLGNISDSISKNKIKLTDRKWKEFQYDTLFEVKKGKRIINSQMKHGSTPCIRPIDKNNGVYKYINIKPNHPRNTITVNYNGSIAEAFYQPKPYFALDDVNVLYALNFTMNVYIAMFLTTLIRLEQYRYNYGRKWHKERMEKSIIKLPVDEKDKPDWEFMESFIKSLPYSSNLQN